MSHDDLFRCLVLAYVGPGAGIAIVGSFLVVLAGVLAAFAGLALWPFRALLRWRRGRHARARALVKRVVVLGLDGLDPRLVTEMLEAGLLPNFARLRDEGCLGPLATTWPP